MKIFIAGPRAINELDENIVTKLKNICKKNYDVLVGDAKGVDSSVQRFLVKKNYKYVTVYASKGIARNNYGNWKIENVKIPNNITGFDFYAQKDLEMAKDSNIGFMIWNGKSKGTFNNIINLLKLNKEVILYYMPNQKFYHLRNMEDFIHINIKIDNKLKKMLLQKDINKFVQMCLF